MEELFITRDGMRFKLDLNEPSGIVLKYQSNLFNDISKISSSYSYSFKLSMTQNNRKAFDGVEDIRHESQVSRKKISCEYYINGVQVTRNANLHVSETSNEYSCVITWDAVSGLQKLNDDSININELRSKIHSTDEIADLADWGSFQYDPNQFNNSSKVLYPCYNAGYPYFNWRWSASSQSDTFNYDKLQRKQTLTGAAKPVVPVRYLLSLINEAYGTRFELGHNSTGVPEEYGGKDDLITYGVIPLTNHLLTDDQEEYFKISQGGYGFSNVKILGEEYVITMRNTTDAHSSLLLPIWVKPSDDPSDYQYTHNKDSVPSNYKLTGFSVEGYAAQIDGVIRIQYRSLNPSDEEPKLKIKAYNHATHKVEDLTSIEPTDVSNQWREYNFRAKDGYDRINLNSGYYTVLFVPEKEPLYVNTSYDVMLDSGNLKSANKIDTITSLPEISCLDFVKSLFYIIGAFPKVNEDGSITAYYYDDIRQNIIDRKCVDWSKKLVNSSREIADSLKFEFGGFCKNNYYLSKNDELEKSSREKATEEDVYADGVGVINVESELLNKEQTVYQSPYNTPYLKNRKAPNLNTGYTVKTWDYSVKDKEINLVVSEPAYGVAMLQSLDKEYMVQDGEYIEYIQEPDEVNKLFGLEIINPFQHMQCFSYLKQIVQNPIQIEEEMILTEMDLHNIDYVKPIYIEKYNSFFALVSITRQNNGISKVELIKLP